MSDSSTRLVTFKYRLYPSKAQAKNLSLVLEVARQFNNMCVGERKWAYALEGRSVSKYDQLAQVKHYKETFPQARLHSHILQVVAADVDGAFAAFFRRVKAGEKPGYPRFKGRNHFHSIGFKEYGNGFRLDGRRLKVYGVGRIPIRWHRPVEGEIKTVRLLHKAGRWYACFSCEVPEAEPLAKTGKAVGLDMGVSAMYTSSDGGKAYNPAYYRQSQRQLRKAQRTLARKQRGSNNRRKALARIQRLQEHTANQRRDYAHKLARRLVNSYDLIGLEDLQIANLVRNRRLSKSILDSGWGLFRQLLTDKAERAGREVVLVNPAYTSSHCMSCGRPFPDFNLSVRWVECACGLSLDRDHHAALQVLDRAGWDTSVSPNVSHWAVRAAEATRLLSPPEAANVRSANKIKPL
jgi:putative transposase